MAMPELFHRVFIGAKLPKEVTDRMAAVQLALKKKVEADLRWIDPSEFVITLCPIGEIALELLMKMPMKLEEAVKGFLPIELKLEGLQGTPNALQPRQACIQLQGETERLIALANEIQRGMQSILGPMEGKGFQPHIMLGRLRAESEPQRVILGRSMRFVKDADAGGFTLDHIAILRNVAVDGVSYEEMKTFPLRG
jgi:2'-5' RNA ligase